MQDRELLSTFYNLAGKTISILFLAGIIALFSGCQEKMKPVFNGYAEGAFVMISAPSAGRLESLAVTRGSQVRTGDLLFVLESEQEKAAVEAAEQEVSRAESQLNDLRKGQRPSELEVISSRLAQAQSTLDLSSKKLERRTSLLDQKLISVEEFDQARSALAHDQAAVTELQAQLHTARLGARNDTLDAGLAYLEVTRARLDQVKWSLEQKSQKARQDALVFDTLFEPGEFVPAGYPIVSLLPPGNIKLRFFVPEPVVGTLKIGQAVSVFFDGSDSRLPAIITYVSPEAAYTPPMIYSQESRAKLVFMIEARPDPTVAKLFHPGQPIDVFLESGHE